MNDLKFAFRQLLKNPGFTAVAVLTLALGNPGKHGHDPPRPCLKTLTFIGHSQPIISSRL